PIPPSLQSHILDPPAHAFPRGIKVPSYRYRQQRLSKLGISTHTPLAHDKAAWWSSVVQEVTWDIDGDQLTVDLIDGSKETWTFDERGLVGISAEFVDDMDMEDQLASSQPTGGVAAASSGAESYERLHHLSVELRSAYEDVGTPSPDLVVAGSPDELLYASSDYDFTELALLAADPSLKFPWEWSGMSSKSEWFEAEPASDSESEPVAPLRRSKRRKSGLRLPKPSSSEIKGQLVDRRRPTAADMNLSPDCPSFSTQSSHRRHDFLSLVALLTETRQTLLHLFTHSILPALKDRLPPTYSIWAATSVEKWFLRSAVRKAADVARIFDMLRSDSGETFDITDEESESEDLPRDLDVFADDEDDFDDFLGNLPSQSSTRDRTGERLRRNILYDMLDDFSLRNWGEMAKERAREVDRQGQQGGDALSTDVPPVWDVSQPYPVSSPESSIAIKRVSRVWERPASPATTNLDSSDSDATDYDDEPGSKFEKAQFFCPADPLEEGLLPRRLPRSLLHHAPGKDMESVRQRVLSLLNEVAGLQRKVAELRIFVEDEMDEWDLAEDVVPLCTSTGPRALAKKSVRVSSPLARSAPISSRQSTEGMSSSPSPKQVARFQALRISIGHTAVGEPIDRVNKRKVITAAGTGPAKKRKKENIVRVRAVSEDPPSGRSPLGRVVAPLKSQPKGVTIFSTPTPRKEPSAKKRQLASTTPRSSPRVEPLEPPLVSPLPPSPELQPIALRLHPAELAAQRSFPTSFERFSLPSPDPPFGMSPFEFLIQSPTPLRLSTSIGPDFLPDLEHTPTSEPSIPRPPHLNNINHASPSND
ncbi:hypothetical protein P7C70_g5788, partial [Phenoliferia sp. Uapishka_3]